MKLSFFTRFFHGIIAFAMIALLVVGLYMSETEAFALYPIHKSVGVIVFFFAVFRIINRIKEGWPEPLGNSSKIQLVVAKVIHWALITMTILYPVSGMLMSGAGGHGINVFGLELVAMNIDAISGEAVPLNETLAGLGHEIHETLTGVLIACIVLHVVGALKHHYIDKDDTLTRMFSR